MKKILIFLASMSVVVTIMFAINPPTNLPSNSNGSRGVTQNSDGSMSINGNASQPSQIGLLSTNGNSYAFVTGPTNATASYNLYLPSFPTNGVLVVTADSTGTNLIASFVQGYTGTLNVLSPSVGSASVTNQVFISNGVITNVTQL